MADYRFEHIEFLYLLAVIPAVFALMLIFHRWRTQSLKRFADSRILEILIPDLSYRKVWIRFGLFSVGISALILAAANPQLGSKLTEAKRKGIDVIIAQDVSNSMLAEDFAPNRLERSKRAISKLIGKLDGDRVGMVIFAGEAFVQLPLTGDYSAAKLFVNSVGTESIESQGTAIAEAIDLSVEAFNLGASTSKAIILISDGEDHEANAIEAAAKAKEIGIQVHCIGIGSPKGTPIPLYRNGRNIGFRKDRNGNTIVTKINEEMLASVARAGGGQYIRATNADAGLDELLEALSGLDESLIETRQFADYEDRFHYFLALALLCFVTEQMISDRKTHSIRQWRLFKTAED